MRIPQITLTAVIILATQFSVFSQNQTNFQKDSTMLRQIFDETLENGRAYEDLRSLTKDIGARLAGSASADMAVEWGYNKLNSYGFDKVYKQEIEVPHWERGTTEKAWYTDTDGNIHQLNILALGGSVATEGPLQAELVHFKTREDLQNAKKKDVKGKIVFISQPMDQKMIETFDAYGACYPIRGLGAIDAAKKGAKAVIIRSLSLSEHPHPHTGTMQYEDGVTKIPAAAISTMDATALEKHMITTRGVTKLMIEMNCKTFPPKKSHNVIAEITGSENPNHIITVGGHLDSWDVGEGAHDDGAGIVHSMEAARTLMALNYQPKNTIRVVFFMNEENGNMGGKTYAELMGQSNEKHIAAIESDRGGFTPRGFSLDGNDRQLKLLLSFTKLFEPYLLQQLEEGYGGVDITPLKSEFKDIALFGFVPDSQRYFEIHHNANDVFETVNKRELHLGAASISSLIYLLDNYL